MKIKGVTAMARTASLRRQHDAAMALVGDIAERIERMDHAASRADAYALTMALAKLEGLLRIHFAQEDRLLYPTLARSTDAAAAATARRFIEEMGAIGPAFEAYIAEWRSADEMMARPADFAAASRALFAALADRIHRENDELYPLADRVAQAQAA